MNFLTVGIGPNQRKIAFLENVLSNDLGSAGLFWLGGFKSDMEGTKATALAKMGGDLGLKVTRFDYSGHGQSSGDFLDGTISHWLEDSLAVFEQTSGPQILIGSSMGAWLALLLNQKLKETGRVIALILIAPAVDMTRDLMLPDFTDKELLSLEEDGFASRPSDYDEPYILTKKLLEDGEKHCLFDGPIEVGCPVYILQGGRDMAVPTDHSLKLVSHLLLDPVFFTLVPDGDHSLSRPQDLELLKTAIVRAKAGEG